MARSMSVKITSSSRHITTQNASIGFKNAIDTIQGGIAQTVTRNLAKTVKAAVRREYFIIATLFQRLCARTPIDENYEKGPHHDHEADDEQCRMHWYLDCNGTNTSKRITAQYLADLRSDIFDVFNDRGSINFIVDILNFELGTQQQINFIFGNDSPYFRTLEYGEYRQDSKNIYTGKLKHGVVNKHSVQAPVGMMRITWGEIQSVVRSSAKTDAATRLKKQVVSKELSPQRMKQIYNLLTNIGGFTLKDMKEFIE